MFAIIKTGGKQYKVQKDSVIFVEKLNGQAGDKVSFDEVLMAGDKVGTPTVKGASVAGEIVKQGRGEKVIVFKKIRRHGYKRKQGHKQDLTVVKITDIKA
ncbi:MAG: 50S ribosomal protein L21 [Lactobacillales bacterium]|jgi:large subunit ribosomal protein L21|nr:50S ribosomal protein L21 [Lactobacillales bacterium]